MYCLIKTLLLVILMHRVRRCRRPNVRDKPFCHRKKLFELKKSCKQQKTNLGARNHREVTTLFQQSTPGDILQSPNCQVAHVRTVKLFSCLRSSVWRFIYICLNFCSTLINEIRNKILRNIIPTNPSMNKYSHAYKYGMKLLYTYQSQTSVVAPLKFWESIRNFITHFMMGVIIHPCGDWI